MNRGHVRSARVAHLYRQAHRGRGALIAAKALRDVLEHAVGAPGPYSPLFAMWAGISNQLERAVKPWNRLHDRLFDRRMVFLDTRLARANGWGSAGSCPAGHDAKTPAVREQVCRVAAAGSGARQVARASARDTSARVSARQQAGGGVR